jgi:6-phosphogluconate dehydrogenase
MTFGAPIPTINAAVDARILSGSSKLRGNGQKYLPESIEQPYPKAEKLTSRVRIALELSIICAYQQGFSLLECASEQKGWKLDFAEIARIWRGGCIIRSTYLAKLEQTYREKKVHPYELERFAGERQLDWRRAVAIGTGRGIPLPAMAASLSYFDALRREHLTQNLIQAQRDFFGAHGFERVDKKGTFHL